MKLLKSDYKKGFLKLKIDNLDDLWYMSHILEKDDVATAFTFRKIKLGEGDERKTKVIKKRVRLSIRVEKIQFSTSSSNLRISGTITEGNDDIPTGSYHTLSVEEGSELEIDKGHAFLSYQIKKVKEATSNKSSSIMVCVIDRDNAVFAMLKKYGYEVISTLKGDVAKKQFDEKNKTNFYADVAKFIKESIERYSLNKVLIGTPNFWKKELSNEIEKQGLGDKVSFASCSAEGENAIKEVLKRPETQNILKDERASQELSLVEELLSRVSKAGDAEYGVKQVKKAAEQGAVEKLMVTDNIIQQLREEDDFDRLDSIMKIVDTQKGEIHIISSQNEAGEKLDSLGGVGAILRFKVY